MLRVFSVIVLLQFSFVSLARADEAKPYDGPVFDAHVHYSSTSWDTHSVADIIAKWDVAGVSRSVVSSTPDDGTLKLLDAAPGRVVPFFRPYRKYTDLGAWYKMPELVAYSEQRLSRGVHVGLGEFHIVRPENVDTPVVRRHLEMAAARGLFIQPHTDAAVLQELLKIVPRLKVIWAHAGFESPASVAAMMDAHANVWADLSFRADDIIGEDGLDEAWRKLLIRHAGRFMIGTDTYLDERWRQYEALVANHRAWLSLLPGDVAEMIAYRNAEKFFGPGDP